MGRLLQRGWKGKAGALLLGIVVLLMMVDGDGGSSKNTGTVPPNAADGMMDLTSWEWDRGGIVPLAGKWRFEWLEGGGAGARDETTLQVPGIWNESRDGSGRDVPNQGFGEYRLTILHRPLSKQLAIRVPNISTSYEMYVNGKLVMSRGKIGENAGHAIPYQMPGTIYVDGSGSRIDIRLAVGNYHHRSGGIRSDLIMGTAEQINRLQNRQAAQEYIVFGCLLMIGLYHIGLFALRRSDMANLFFAMLCLFVGFRMGLIGEGFLLQWLPSLNWELATRLDYLAFLSSGWSGMAYYQSMYPGELRRSWIAVSGGVALALAIGALSLPTVVFTSWLLVYQAYVLAACIIVISGLILSAFRRREGSWLALTGMVGMMAAIVNDMLFYNGWWHSVDLVPLGLLFLIVLNSFIIASRYAKTFERVEQMSSELRDWNDRLEERIADRTEELRKSYETLEEANLGLERMENSRRQLLGNISHDLRTPITLLQGYLEALRDGVITDDQQRDSTIRLMLGKVEGLNGLIHDLFELSVLEARRVELGLTGATLEEWGERLRLRFGQDMRDRGIGFDCVVERAGDQQVMAWIDERKMDRVFSNLLFNAVRYTPEGGMIRIVLSVLPGRQTVEVRIEDSGSGIHPDDLPLIFDRFYKKDKSRHSSSGGSGLGLAISREIVELHGGSISAGNRPEGGAVFRILLPLREGEGTGGTAAG